MSFINELANYNNKKSLANRFRNKRFAFFESQLEKLNNGKTITILDVGGTESFWINRGYQEKLNIEIILLNLTQFETHHPNMTSVKGDACDLSEYDNNKFDLVFSNSVIEHLYTFENQKRMAEEVQRVGKNYYIQTPYKYFFVEPHYLLPYFQFLPKKAKIFILSKTKLSRGTKISVEDAKDQAEQIILVSKKRMKQLFPTAKIYKEKFLGMTKSLTAYKIKMIFNRIFIFIISIFFISCSTDEKKIEKLKDTSILIKLGEKNYALNLYDISKSLVFEDIPKTVPYDSLQTKKYANLIMKDSIVVLHSFKPQYIPIEKITWKENPENNQTWQAYYENLFFISILNHTYHDYGDIRYHEKAKNMC
ncbi:MAG: hypothetical protein COA40_04170 [Aequorivita sp.]|nr:MAG: hypothetical protein COA40_04170 [Aequorivita sp.]